MLRLCKLCSLCKTTCLPNYGNCKKGVENKGDLMSGKRVIKKGHIKLTILKTYTLTLLVGK